MTRPATSVAPEALPREVLRDLYDRYAARCLEAFAGHRVAVVIAGPVNDRGQSTTRYGVLTGADAAAVHLFRGRTGTELISLPHVATVRHDMDGFGEPCPACNTDSVVT